MKTMVLIEVTHPDEVPVDRICSMLNACIDAGVSSANDIAVNTESESADAVADANEQLKLEFGQPEVMPKLLVAIDVEGGCVQNVLVTDETREREYAFSYAVEDADGTDESEADDEG